MDRSFNDIDEMFRRDKDLVLAAVSNSWRAIDGVDPYYKHDKEVALAALTDRKRILNNFFRSFPDFINDNEVVLKAIEIDSVVLIDADERFRNDREIVLTAVKLNGESLYRVNERFRNDREIVLAAIKSYPVLDIVDNTLKLDKDILAMYFDLYDK